MSRGPAAWAAVVIGALAVWHVVAGALCGLGDAEALYFCYALHPAAGYLDHPPMIGWLIAAATAALGDSPGAVRLVPALCHAAALAGAYVLGRDAFRSREAGFGAVAALALIPMVTVGGMAAAPDAPASALWLWTGVALSRALRRAREDRRRASWLDAPVVGVLIGATFLAKHTGALLVASALMALSHPAHRRLLRGPGPALAALACLAVVSPVVLWNHAHGWASVLHRLVWTQQGFGPSLATLGATVGGQLLYLGPPMAVALGWALVALVRDRGDPERHLLLSLAAPPLLFTAALCLCSPAAEPHWTAQGWLAVAVAAGGLMPRRGERTRAASAVLWSAVALLAAALVALHLAVFTTLLPDALGARRYEPRHDLSTELHGWPEVAEAALAARSPGEPLAGSHYTICSQLAFGLARVRGRGAARVLCLSREVDDFDLWGDGSADGVDAVLYVEDDRFGAPAAEVFGPGWRLERVGELDLRRGRWVVRRFRFVRAVRG